MEQRPAILFDDGRGLLSPLTDLRPAFDVRTGALTIRDRLEHALGVRVESLYVPESMIPLAREIHPELPVNRAAGGDPGEPVLLASGRCPLPLDLHAALEPGQAAVEGASGDLVAAVLPRAQAAALLAGSPPDLETIRVEGSVLLSRPWHWRGVRDASIATDLALLLGGPAVDAGLLDVLGDHPVRVDPAATVYPGVLLNAEAGPIVIEAGATVRPHAVIAGPAVIGRGATVLEQAFIKPHTAIGPVCKAAGEIGGTVFQGFANKAHDGHLGDSWVGEWVNLGAGTVNSNLLNTYGEVRCRPTPSADPEPTGERYLGCTLGDHTKTAIGTRIMTGAIVGTGTMWADDAQLAGTTPPFLWASRGKLTRYEIERFIEVARTVMARRDREPGDAYTQRLRNIAASS